MKYLILVGDGMADLPIGTLNGETPLAAAATPNMDRCVKEGEIGLVQTVPAGMAPGSDAANMSLMGIDPQKYFCNRGPLEAASMNVLLAANETAFRCNLVTLRGDIMDDYSAGHIGTEDAREVIALLAQKLNSDTVKFYHGVSYRHLVVISNLPAGDLSATPPHDLSDKQWTTHQVTGPGAQTVLDLMSAAREILKNCDFNKRRIAVGQKPVTDIWLWGQGKSINVPTISDRFGLSGSVISAVDLVRGLGRLAGLTIRIVDGATGYLGTNYAGKVAAAQLALTTEDFVYLHVEAPDETSHEGSLEKKLQAIDEFDRHVVGPMLSWADTRRDVRIMIAIDHATPLATKTHASGAVPYAIFGNGISSTNVSGFSEKAAAGISPLTGPQLFEKFIRGF